MNMDDLISRKALYDAMKKREEMYAEGNCLYDAYNYHVSAEIVSNAPFVPAVPLDKLCEWLDKNNDFVPFCADDKADCNSCELEGAECIKKRIMLWMEGQHEP